MAGLVNNDWNMEGSGCVLMVTTPLYTNISKFINFHTFKTLHLAAIPKRSVFVIAKNVMGLLVGKFYPLNNSEEEISV
jgi:hypothetical protein